MQLILATHNQHKAEEINAMLKGQPIEVVTLDEVGITDDIEETGTTFEENAILKAEWAAKRTNRWAIADDSGLEIAAFNNEPGVYSARYLGEKTPYEIKNAIILERLGDSDNREARYVSVVAIARPGHKTLTFRGEMRGRMATQAAGSGGFGYDPIFIAEGYTRSVAELPMAEKNRISHRYKALSLALEALKGEVAR